jgi:DNA-binding SARP family transcriptional activator
VGVPESELLTLGRFLFRANGKDVAPPSTQKARALLTYLVMHAGKDQARERILELFWPDAFPDRARQSLKTATWSIRRSLRSAGLDPDEFLDAGKFTIRWKASTRLDAGQFLELARDGDPRKQSDALAVYHGDFLEGDYEEWSVAERERLASAYEELLGTMLKRSPDPRIAQLLVARNPYEESVYATLIDAEIAAGRSLAAAALVERCRAALAEVGSKPSAEFEQRYARTGVVAQIPAEPRLPFVARDSTLAALARGYDRAAAGRGTLCIVHGEAGIGKSSVLDAAARAAIERGLHIIRVRGLENDPRAFGPWAGVLESQTGISFEQFAQAGGTSISMRLAEELNRAFVPHTVMFVDDGHVLRGESLDVLGKLAAIARASAHVVVVATRPEGLNRLRLAFGEVDVDELPLGRLTLSELEHALAHIAGLESSSLARVLYDRTGGHPLFTDGLLRSLAHTGVLEHKGTRWQLGRLPTRIALPDDVKRFIEVELVAAGDDACLVACSLSLDADASASDLVTVLGLAEERILDGIDELLARGLLTQPSIGPEFAFAHDLIGEVASTLLNPGRRVRIHAAFARLLEDHTERGASGRRARHLAAAGNGRAAAIAYAGAAIEALEWFAWRDARERCAAGLRAIEPHASAAEGARTLVRLKLVDAKALVAGGDDEAAVAPIKQAVELARLDSDDDQLLESLIAGAQIQLNCHLLDACIAAALEAQSLAGSRGDNAALSRALAILSSAYCHFGRERESVAAAQGSYDAAQRSQKPDVVTAAADTLLRMQITWWHYGQAIETAEVGLQRARRAGWVLEGALRFTRGALWYYLERYREAEEELEAALSIAEDETGERRWLITLAGIDRLKLRFFTRYMLGVVYAARKEWPRAIDTAVALSQAPLYATSYMIKNNVLNLRIDALLGRRERGDVEEAARLVGDLHEDPFAQGSILDLSACVDLSRARVAAALRSAEAEAAWLRARVAVATNADMTPLEADRAFDQLATAAEDLGNERFRRDALAMRDRLRDRRMQAAGAGWGGPGAGSTAALAPRS